MTKAWWKKRALEWKEKYLDMRHLRNIWRNKYQSCKEELNECGRRLTDCEDDLRECKGEPDPNPTPDKKLTVENGKILYGGSPIKLCGVSRWEALWRATGEHGYPYDWGQYSLEWYENKLIESGINYVRHGGIRNTNLLYNHCKRMKDAGIIVEVTVFRAHKKSKGLLVELDEMGELAKLGNVFFDINNEFLDEPKNVEMAIDVAKWLKHQGCIISGGAWSGLKGLRQSIDFHNLYNGLDINSHHRAWQEASFREDVRRGKPVVFNEFFAFRSGMSLARTKQIMNLAFKCDIQAVTYYGFRDSSMFPGLKNDDPFDYRDMLKYAGEMARQLNGK